MRNEQKMRAIYLTVIIFTIPLRLRHVLCGTRMWLCDTQVPRSKDIDPVFWFVYVVRYCRYLCRVWFYLVNLVFLFPHQPCRLFFLTLVNSHFRIILVASRKETNVFVYNNLLVFRWCLLEVVVYLPFWKILLRSWSLQFLTPEFEC